MAREEVKTEVLVVGGGAVGVSVARYFALAGEDPLLNSIFERAVANEVPARLL